MVIEFCFFNMNKNYNIAFLLISHTIYNIFSTISLEFPFPLMWNEMHSDSENSNFKMYRVDAK